MPKRLHSNSNFKLELVHEVGEIGVETMGLHVKPRWWNRDKPAWGSLKRREQNITALKAIDGKKTNKIRNYVISLGDRQCWKSNIMLHWALFLFCALFIGFSQPFTLFANFPLSYSHVRFYSLRTQCILGSVCCIRQKCCHSNFDFESVLAERFNVAN